MNDNRMRERIQRAVQQRCAPLAPDPFLAARVMRMAEQKGEMKVKKKLSVTMILCIVLMLVAAATVAAVLLSGQEIIDQQAVPVAQQNDGDVRINGKYTHEELAALVALAAENGISLENEAFIREALAKGEGYWEDETIMAICQEAFGGLYYEWSVEERHWFGEKMVEIGFQDVNYDLLPGEGQIPADEARALAVTLLESEFGSLPLADETRYRRQEDFDEAGWYITYYPLNLVDAKYHIYFSHDRSVVETNCTPQLWEVYSEAELMYGIDSTYGYRTLSPEGWSQEGWYTFGQMLPDAIHTDVWSAEHDGYLASTYLLPQEGDITEKEAIAIAEADAGQDVRLTGHGLLLGRGEERIWKVTLLMLDESGERVTRAWEIDAATGEIQHRMTFDGQTMSWARYMLYETYEAVSGDTMTEDDAVSAAIAALQAEYGALTPALDDPSLYGVTVRAHGDGQTYTIIFKAKTLDNGNTSVRVKADGSTKIKYADFGPLTADNLFSRTGYIYDSGMRWDQTTWVEFDRLLDTLPAPTAFAGKLFAATSYPDASVAKITLDEALDIVQLDLGSKADEAISWVLIDAEPHPVWKIRMGTFPANTLFEVDAITGEILDREIYVIQNPDFDHTMKMYTLRSTYMPAALEEFGPERIAMELTVKSDFDAFSYNETIFMDENIYQTTVEGMTVTFTCVDGSHPSYRTTILDNGMDAQIEVFDIPAPEDYGVHG